MVREGEAFAPVLLLHPIPSGSRFSFKKKKAATLVLLHKFAKYSSILNKDTFISAS